MPGRDAMTTRATLAIWAVLATTLSTLAAEPKLAVYPTDDDKNVYVALYGNGAVELAGCPSPAAARALLALPDSAAITETSLSALKSAHDLSHPRIPCSADTAFNAEIPENTPVWFDLESTLRFYMPSPKVQGLFYSIPGRCEAIRAAFDMRQRIAKPGVLRGQTAPPTDVMLREFTLDCGDAAVAPEIIGSGSDTPGQWSLNSTEAIFLGKMIYVAAFGPANGSTGEKNYLAIYRINGAPTWEASSPLVEKDLRTLFGIAEDDEVKVLKAEELSKAFSAPFIDLCLTACDGYPYRHASLTRPGEILSLAELPGAVAERRIGTLGESVLRWTYAPDRAASFAACDRLTGAMGMSAEGNPDADWESALDVNSDNRAMSVTSFRCPVEAADLCLRNIRENGILSQAILARGDCPSAKHLRIALPAKAMLADTLTLDGTSFASIEIVSKGPQGRSELTAAAIAAQAPASICLFEAIPAIISVKGPVRLRLDRIDLIRAKGDGEQPAVGLAVENAQVGLNHVTIGTLGNDGRPIERAVRLCKAELYALGGAFEASVQGIHGMASRVAIGGAAGDTAKINSGGVGLSMITGSIARVNWLTMKATRTVLLRGSTLKGAHVALESDGAATSTGVHLEQGAFSELSESSASNFGCIGKLDAGSKAKFILSDLSDGNIRRSCGSGTMEVIP